MARSPQLSDDLANRSDEHRFARTAGGLRRLHASVAQHHGSPGTAGNLQRAQAPGNPDQRTDQRTRSARTAQQDSRSGAGTGEPEPARIPAARTDESDSEGTRRIRRRSGGNRRASQESRRVRHVRGSQEGMRPRTEAAREDDSGFGRVHGLAHLSRMDDFAALEQNFRHRGHRHSQGRQRFSTKITTTWSRSRNAFSTISR